MSGSEVTEHTTWRRLVRLHHQWHEPASLEIRRRLFAALERVHPPRSDRLPAQLIREQARWRVARELDASEAIHDPATGTPRSPFIRWHVLLHEELGDSAAIDLPLLDDWARGSLYRARDLSDWDFEQVKPKHWRPPRGEETRPSEPARDPIYDGTDDPTGTGGHSSQLSPHDFKVPDWLVSILMVYNKAYDRVRTCWDREFCDPIRERRADAADRLEQLVEVTLSTSDYHSEHTALGNALAAILICARSSAPVTSWKPRLSPVASERAPTAQTRVAAWMVWAALAANRGTRYASMCARARRNLDSSARERARTGLLPDTITILKSWGWPETLEKGAVSPYLTRLRTVIEPAAQVVGTTGEEQ